MPPVITTPIPVRTPIIHTDPNPNPARRLHPDELCPTQKERVVHTIRRSI